MLAPLPLQRQKWRQRPHHLGRVVQTLGGGGGDHDRRQIPGEYLTLKICLEDKNRSQKIETLTHLVTIHTSTMSSEQLLCKENVDASDARLGTFAFSPLV